MFPTETALEHRSKGHIVPDIAFAGCPWCDTRFGPGEFTVIAVVPPGRAIRRCDRCGCEGPTPLFRDWASWLPLRRLHDQEVSP